MTALAIFTVLAVLENTLSLFAGPTKYRTKRWLPPLNWTPLFRHPDLRNRQVTFSVCCPNGREDLLDLVVWGHSLYYCLETLTKSKIYRSEVRRQLMKSQRIQILADSTLKNFPLQRLRTRLTTARDRKLQFWGAGSIGSLCICSCGFVPFLFLLVAQWQWQCSKEFSQNLGELRYFRTEENSKVRKPWSANRELRGWQRGGCQDRCQEGPAKGAKTVNLSRQWCTNRELGRG